MWCTLCARAHVSIVRARPRRIGKGMCTPCCHNIGFIRLFLPPDGSGRRYLALFLALFPPCANTARLWVGSRSDRRQDTQAAPSPRPAMLCIWPTVPALAAYTHNPRPSLLPHTQQLLSHTPHALMKQQQPRTPPPTMGTPVECEQQLPSGACIVCADNISSQYFPKALWDLFVLSVNALCVYYVFFMASFCIY